MRPLIVLTALSALALTTPAFAATDMGVTDAATVEFVVHTASGQDHPVRVLATLHTLASTGPAATVRVHVLDTGSKSSGAPATFTVGGGGATLRTTVAGQPLIVTWTGTANSRAVSVGEASSDSRTMDGYTVSGTGATARISWGAANCSSEATVVGQALTYDTNGYGGPLTRSVGFSLKGAQCKPAVTSTLPVP